MGVVRVVGSLASPPEVGAQILAQALLSGDLRVAHFADVAERAWGYEKLAQRHPAAPCGAGAERSWEGLTFPTVAVAQV